VARPSQKERLERERERERERTKGEERISGTCRDGGGGDPNSILLLGLECKFFCTGM
jgi:hypothetical protein